MKSPEEMAKVRRELEKERWAKVDAELEQLALSPLTSGEIWVPIGFDYHGFSQTQVTERLAQSGWTVKWHQPISVIAVLTPKEKPGDAS